MDLSVLNPFTWDSEPFIVLIILALFLRYKLSTPVRRWQRIASETLAIGPAVLLYFLVRGFVNARFESASENARRIIEMEQHLRIYREAELQDAILGSDNAVNIVNWMYIWGHWPAIAAVVFWLVFTRPAAYPRYRNALILSGALGMIIFATFPVTPPRLMDGMTFVDTVTERSRSYRVFQPPGLTNPYAAMPSLHFGWNLLMGIALFQQSRRIWTRGLAVLMPVAMYLAIVLTANHFILDGVVGGLLVLTSLAMVSSRDWPREVLRSMRSPALPLTTGCVPITAVVPDHRPLIVAHRHGNSMELLRQAEAAGAHIIEADVWLHRGNLEVRHTKTLGPVPVLWDRWSIEGAYAPRSGLRDLLTAARPHTLLMLDIKGRDPTIAERVIRELEAHYPGRPVLICSQNWMLLEPFRAYPLATLVHSIGNRWQLRRAWSRLETSDCDAVSIQFRLLDDRSAQMLKERVSLVLSWPVNTPERLQQVTAWHIDGAIVDDLELPASLAKPDVLQPVAHFGQTKIPGS